MNANDPSAHHRGPAMPEADERLDARNLACPLPVLKAQRRLLAMAPGERLVVEATDPMAAIDLPNLCREEGYRLLASGVSDGVLRFLIQKSR